MPQGPRAVELAAHVNWDTAQVTFSEVAENGIAIVNPPQVTVPMMLVMRIASEAIFQSLPPGVRALNFAPPGKPEAQNQRGGRSLAFDAKIGGKSQ